MSALYFFSLSQHNAWRMSGDGRADFLAERISGAQHFDIDEVADKTSPYPHMVPSETEFQDHVGKVSDSG